MQQAAAWAAAAEYLQGRIQATPEHKPGRKPDMSQTASAAMKAVMVELWTAARSVNSGAPQWTGLYEQLENGASPQADGAAASHAADARNEAAQALIYNHERVLLDITNPSPNKNIDGNPLTQLELVRVPTEQRPHVDALLVGDWCVNAVL